MASKWISAILWTLVSVNLITLVLGGLITWLGYAIPIRLRQFGLSPEVTQVAGFAALLVACLGLCGLNYSSHHALNLYGLSCAIFIMLMLFGILPANWRRAIYGPPSEVEPPQPDQNTTTATTANTGQYLSIGANGTLHKLVMGRARHNQNSGGLVIDLIYIALLLVLSILLSFAFILAQYLRRRELDPGHHLQELEEEAVGVAGMSPNDLDDDYASHDVAVLDCGEQARRSRGLAMRLRRARELTRRPLSSGQQLIDCSPSNCTCATGLTLARQTGEDGNQHHSPSKGHLQARPLHAGDKMWHSAVGWTTTLATGGQNSRPLSNNSGDPAANNNRSKSPTTLDGNQVDMNQFLSPLSPKDVYYARDLDLDRDDDGDDDGEGGHTKDRELDAYKVSGLVSAAGQANQRKMKQGRHSAGSGQPLQVDIRCRCSDLHMARAGSGASPSLASSKLDASQLQQIAVAPDYNGTLPNGTSATIHSSGFHTMPSKFNPSSSVYAIRSAGAFAQVAGRYQQQRRNNLDSARKEKRAKHSSGTSVMAMTAAAAAALLGGVGGVLDGAADQNGLADIDDGLQVGHEEYATESFMSHHHHQGDRYGMDYGQAASLQMDGRYSALYSTGRVSEPVMDFGHMMQADR